MLHLRTEWRGLSLDDAFSSWWHSEETKSHRMVPLIISWGLWIAKNELIFKDKGSSPVEIALKAVGLIVFYTDSDPPPRMRSVTSKIINEELPWGFFDGVVGGDSVCCRGGLVLHLDAQKYVHIKAGFGQGTNNFAELSTLKLLMIKALEWGAHSIQIFGDSKLTINWAMGSHRCNILRLTPLLDEILFIKCHFDFISFTHVYRERNSTADKLSKEGS